MGGRGDTVTESESHRLRLSNQSCQDYSPSLSSTKRPYCASVDPETSCWFDPFFLGILSSEGERLTWEVKANGEVILFILELNYLY